MADTTPNVSTLTKVYYAETLAGTKIQVAYTESIPKLEEAPDQITTTVLDLDYEIAGPGIKKASKLEIPILFTHTQHKALKALNKSKEYFWFFVLPDNTAETTGKPLCRYFQATENLGLDEIKAGEFLKETLTLYKSTDVTEVEGLPAQA